jgi:pimeloyl-ACP methyl ester carboxylesterase
MLSGRGYPARELAADAVAILDAEGLATVHLAAIGWGATTALALATTAPDRVASLVLAAPYLPALLAKSKDAVAHQAELDHLEMVRDAADSAEKGQMDHALDLYLGARIGADWRDRFSKPRLGAIRRAAANLGPLLSGLIADPIDREALQRLDMPVLLLIKHDTSLLERATVDALESLIPRARIESILPVRDRPIAPGAEWTEPIVRAISATTQGPLASASC